MMIFGIAIPAGLLITMVTAMVFDWLDLRKQVKASTKAYNDIKKRL